MLGAPGAGDRPEMTGPRPGTLGWIWQVNTARQRPSVRPGRPPRGSRSDGRTSSRLASHPLCCRPGGIPLPSGWGITPSIPLGEGSGKRPPGHLTRSKSQDPVVEELRPCPSRGLESARPSAVTSGKCLSLWGLSCRICNMGITPPSRGHREARWNKECGPRARGCDRHTGSLGFAARGPGAQHTPRRPCQRAHPGSAPTSRCPSDKPPETLG